MSTKVESVLTSRSAGTSSSGQPRPSRFTHTVDMPRSGRLHVARRIIADVQKPVDRDTAALTGRMEYRRVGSRTDLGGRQRMIKTGVQRCTVDL